MKAKLYVGCIAAQSRTVFRSPTVPTWESHGDKFNACIGPFRTKRGAEFMAQHGQGNPHCTHVSQAEWLGKKYAGQAV